MACRRASVGNCARLLRILWVEARRLEAKSAFDIFPLARTAVLDIIQPPGWRTALCVGFQTTPEKRKNLILVRKTLEAFPAGGPTGWREEKTQCGYKVLTFITDDWAFQLPDARGKRANAAGSFLYIKWQLSLAEVPIPASLSASVEVLRVALSQLAPKSNLVGPPQQIQPEFDARCRRCWTEELNHDRTAVWRGERDPPHRPCPEAHPRSAHQGTQSAAPSAGTPC